MKYKKIAGLLAMGSLIAPTVLSAQKVFAVDTDGTVSSSQVAQSSTTAASTQTSQASASPAVEPASAAKQTVQSSTPAVSSTSSVASTDSTTASTTQSSTPAEKTYSIALNDTELTEASQADEHGNELTFDNFKDVKAGTQVTYQLKLAENYELDGFVTVETADGTKVPVQSGPDKGTFTMPAGDVLIKAAFKEKAPASSSTESSSSSSSSESSTTSSSSSSSSSSTTTSSSASSNSSQSSNSSSTGGSSNHSTGSTNDSSSNPSSSSPSEPNGGSNNQGSQNSNNNNGSTGNNGVTPPTTVPSDNASAGRQPAGTSNDIKTPSSDEVPAINNDVRQALVTEAYKHLGKAYVWGAKGPDTFDCSGLTHYVYAKVTGHNIGGWTGDQQYSGAQIPVSEAQPGDLLFWGAPTSVTSHVAIYIGNGQYIHAPQPGDVVKITNLSDFMPTFAVRVNVAGLEAGSASTNGSIGSIGGGEDGSGDFVFNKNQSTDQFIDKIGEFAREVGQEHDIYASVMMAQAILESGSGNSSLASEPNYNLFGIKGKYKGKGVTFSTLEQDDKGSSYQIQAEFRKYPTYKESLEDYAGLLKDGISGNKNYYKPTWKSETGSYKDATKYLQGRYATDKQYAKKLNAIIDTYHLTDFDHKKEAKNDASLMSNKHKISAKKEIGPKLKDLNTAFVLNDVLKTKLITDITIGPKLPTMLSTQYFVDLFRGDSLIALAATSAKAQQRNEEQDLPTNSPIYIALSKSLMAILPPVE